MKYEGDLPRLYPGSSRLPIAIKGAALESDSGISSVSVDSLSSISFCVLSSVVGVISVVFSEVYGRSVIGIVAVSGSVGVPIAASSSVVVVGGTFPKPSNRPRRISSSCSRTNFHRADSSNVKSLSGSVAMISSSPI